MRNSTPEHYTPEGGDSFLPRIQSVFYAVFDVRQGPKIVYQVPEGLIAVPLAGLSLPSGSIPPTPSSEAPSNSSCPSAHSSCTSLTSPSEINQNVREFSSPRKSSPSIANTLFNFDEVSKYVIPPPALCGRLVTCSTKRHRVIGFPTELRGKYQRNYFRYNLCFVFDRGADLSCYEPVIRKIGRVLTACEEESGFLSSSSTSHALHAILEQLYEDLNSYSETSIVIDRFTSIELKIFPFYPNPPPVQDWMVPLALINLSKRIEDNWDLTMVKVCKHIDGVNHISRIAHLADCDIALTRLAISHLLYYQVIMVIDIFQFSNMYTLRKSIQWLANESHVRDECGPYVTKPGKPIPDWPQLLYLYSRLKAEKTILEWMQMHNVSRLGIDVRRFISFGVIKGFLRRVHRWPTLLPPGPSEMDGMILNAVSQGANADINATLRKRGKSLTNTLFDVAGNLVENQLKDVATIRGRQPHSALPPRISVQFHGQSMGQPSTGGAVPILQAPFPSAASASVSVTQRARRASAAERVLEQLRNRDLQRTGAASSSSPRTTWMHQPHTEEGTRSRAASMSANVAAMPGTAPAEQPPPPGTSSQLSPGKSRIASEHRRPMLAVPAVPPPSPVTSKLALPSIRPRLSRSPSAPHLIQQQSMVGAVSHVSVPKTVYPQELVLLLNGDHHTDELAVRFEAGWPLLERWLVTIGGGTGNGDYGRVVIVYQ
ncbi:hypothetical protein AX17_002849 [Amanita inopinata Kibby_2008]|nr:hypothetical protein AX17_002849 [Amanita inopinata Kibby_2008]